MLFSRVNKKASGALIAWNVLLRWPKSIFTARAAYSEQQTKVIWAQTLFISRNKQTEGENVFR